MGIPKTSFLFLRLLFMRADTISVEIMLHVPKFCLIRPKYGSSKKIQVYKVGSYKIYVEPARAILPDSFFHVRQTI